MKIANQSLNQTSRTFLKSTSHIRVLDSPSNYLRSVLVGLQFGIIHLPNEIVTLVIVPFVRDIFSVLFDAASNLKFVLHASCTAIFIGFTGVLEATDDAPVHKNLVSEEKD